MRHSMAGWLLCGLVGGFAMTVAAQTGKDSGAELAGTSWRLVEFRGGDDTVLTPDDKDRYTLAFAGNGRVSVRVDCNRGFAAWSSDGPGQIKFGPMGLTRMMCPPAALSDNIVKQWEHVRSYVVKDGRLYLSLMTDGGMYELEPLPSSGSNAATGGATAPLEKTDWRLIRLGDETVTAADPQRTPNLVLDPTSHRVSGSGGCNRVSGGYELKGEQLTFGQMTSTRMACPSGMETEQKFLAALRQVKKWKIAGRQLELMDNSGTVVAVLEAGGSKATE
jgi:heat shock protein HslJ